VWYLTSIQTHGSFGELELNNQNAGNSGFFSTRFDTCAFGLRLMHGVRQAAENCLSAPRWLHDRAQLKYTAIWLVLVLAIGTCLRYYFLSEPMRYDEAFTFLNFVNREISKLFFYPVPNNHVLHTILVRISVEIFGGSPVAIRLPAFVAGVCVIPLTFCLARLLTGDRRSGYLASGLVAVFPYLVLYDTMARGYSLLVLLSLCLAIMGYRFVEHPSKGLCFLMSLVIALGLFDIPSFLFPAAGILLWVLAMLISQGRGAVWILTELAVPCAVATIGLTVLFYTPVIIENEGIETLTGNRFVKSLPMPQFFRMLPDHILHTVSDFAWGIPSAAIPGAVLLLVAGLVGLVRKRNWCGFSILPALFVGGGLALFAKHAIPYTRTWIYFLPFVFCVLDAGFVYIVRLKNTLPVRIVLLVFVAGAAVLMMNRNLIASYDDTGYFREASAVVDVLGRVMKPGDDIKGKSPADAAVIYYIWYRKIAALQIPAGPVADRKRFFMVQKSKYSIRELVAEYPTGQPVKKIFEFGDAELYVSDLK